MEIFDDSTWQMSRGERAALEGLLTQARPALALEIGSAEGGSLARIARHAGEVHSFDYVRPQFADDGAGNVVFHTGDPNELLPPALASLAEAGRNVDFVLLDGDSAPDGARRSLEALLDSPALGRTLILVHQVSNPRVRQGFDAVHFDAWPKVAFVEPDFVGGYMLAAESMRHELWGGLALVEVDAGRLRYQTGSVMAERYFPTATLLAQARAAMVSGGAAADATAGADATLLGRIERLERELGDAEHEVGRLRSVARHHEELWRSLMDSWSWRLTRPIRLAKERTRGGGDGGGGGEGVRGGGLGDDGLHGDGLGGGGLV